MSSLDRTDPKISHVLRMEEKRQMVKVITDIDNQDIQNQVRQEVSQICQRFPVPGIDD